MTGPTPPEQEPPAGVTNQGKTQLLFDSNHPEFIRGFEAGSIWGVMGRPMVAGFECFFRDWNIEMVMRMAEARGFSYQTVFEDTDGFIKVRFLRNGIDQNGRPQ